MSANRELIEHLNNATHKKVLSSPKAGDYCAQAQIDHRMSDGESRRIEKELRRIKNARATLVA
jgi:hypothetical protein